MRVKIHFHKLIQPYTRDLPSIEIEVDDLHSISFAINTYFPELIQHFINESTLVENKTHNDFLLILDKDKKMLNESRMLRNNLKPNEDEFYILPCICGNGNGKSAILIGALVLATAFFAIPAIAGAGAGAIGSLSGFSSVLSSGSVLGFLGKAVVGFGLNLILGGILSLINKPPELGNQETDSDSRNNDSFGPLVNSTDSSNLIPLNYGEIRVAGQLLSGFLKTIDHGKEDIINVNDQFSA